MEQSMFVESVWSFRFHAIRRVPYQRRILVLVLVCIKQGPMVHRARLPWRCVRLMPMPGMLATPSAASPHRHGLFHRNLPPHQSAPPVGRDSWQRRTRRTFRVQGFYSRSAVLDPARLRRTHARLLCRRAVPRAPSGRGEAHPHPRHGGCGRHARGFPCAPPPALRHLRSATCACLMP